MDEAFTRTQRAAPSRRRLSAGVVALLLAGLLAGCDLGASPTTNVTTAPATGAEATTAAGGAATTEVATLAPIEETADTAEATVEEEETVVTTVATTEETATAEMTAEETATVTGAEAGAGAHVTVAEMVANREGFGDQTVTIREEVVRLVGTNAFVIRENVPVAGAVGTVTGGATLLGETATAGAMGDETATAGAMGDETATAGAMGDETATAGAMGDETATAGAMGDETATATGATGTEAAGAVEVLVVFTGGATTTLGGVETATAGAMGGMDETATTMADETATTMADETATTTGDGTTTGAADETATAGAMTAGETATTTAGDMAATEGEIVVITGTVRSATDPGLAGELGIELDDEELQNYSVVVVATTVERAEDTTGATTIDQAIQDQFGQVITVAEIVMHPDQFADQQVVVQEEAEDVGVDNAFLLRNNVPLNAADTASRAEIPTIDTTAIADQTATAVDTMTAGETTAAGGADETATAGMADETATAGMADETATAGMADETATTGAADEGTTTGGVTITVTDVQGQVVRVTGQVRSMASGDIETETGVMLSEDVLAGLGERAMVLVATDVEVVR